MILALKAHVIQEVAAGLGVALRVPLERRLAGAERVGEHKTSTLQEDNPHGIGEAIAEWRRGL